MATVKVQLPVACRAHPVFYVAAVQHFVEDTSLRGNCEKPPEPILDFDGNKRYFVEEILSEQQHRGRRQFLVKWIGYDELTWEPEANVLDESGQPILPLKRFLASKGGRE